MLSLTELLHVIALASIIINQVYAHNFIEDALENLQRHQVAQSKLLGDKYQEQRDDEDDDINVRTLDIQDLAALLEQALNTDEVQKRTQENKKQKYKTYLDKLNELDLDDVLVYYPDNKKPIRSDEKERNIVLDMLGLSDYAKATSVSLNGVHKKVGRKERQVHKVQNSEKNMLDQLNELDMDKVLLYDPNSDRPIRTERKVKNPLLDLLSSPNYDVDSDDLNDEAQVYIIQFNADAIRKTKSEKNLNDLLSTQFKMSSQKSRRDHKKEHRYKGFRVKDAHRRMRGDTHEKFASEEIEDKRPQKRPRGFGGVARTPIPYIKHRGDIYEKYL